MELTVAASIYAYKDRLADGFDRGLAESMKQYGPFDVKKTADFDLMQATVSRKYHRPILPGIFSNLIRSLSAKMLW